MKWKKVISGVLTYAMVISSVVSSAPLQAAAEENQALEVPGLVYTAPVEGETAKQYPEVGYKVRMTENIIERPSAQKGVVDYKAGEWGFNGEYEDNELPAGEGFGDVYLGHKVPLVMSFRMYIPSKINDETELIRKGEQYVFTIKGNKSGGNCMTAWYHGTSYSNDAYYRYDEYEGGEEGFFGKWHDIQIVFGEENGKSRHMIYVDGKRGHWGDGSTSIDQPDRDANMVHKNNRLSIGSRAFADLGGLISDFKVYNGEGMTESQKETFAAMSTLQSSQVTNVLSEIEPKAEMGLEPTPQFGIESQWYSKDASGANITMESPDKFVCGTGYEAMTTLIAPEGYAFPTTDAYKKAIEDKIDAGRDSTGITKDVKISEDGKNASIKVNYPAMNCNIKDIELPAKFNAIAEGESVKLQPLSVPMGSSPDHAVTEDCTYDFEVAEGSDYVSVTRSGLLTAKAVGKAVIRITARPGDAAPAYAKEFSIEVISENTAITPGITYTKPAAGVKPSSPSVDVTERKMLVNTKKGTTLNSSENGEVVTKEGREGFTNLFTSAATDDDFDIQGHTTMVISMDVYIGQKPTKEVYLFAKGGNAQRHNQFYLNYLTSNAFQFWGENDNWPNASKNITDDFFGNWHKIVAVYSGGKDELYIDGEKGSRRDRNVNPQHRDYPFKISSSELVEFGGCIANFEFYSGKYFPNSPLDISGNNSVYATVENWMEGKTPTASISLLKPYEETTVWSVIGGDTLGENDTFDASNILGGDSTDAKGYVATTTLTAIGGYEFSDAETIQEKVAAGTSEGETSHVKVNVSEDKKTAVIRVYYGEPLTIGEADIADVAYTAPANDAAASEPTITVPEGAHYETESFWMENGLDMAENAVFTAVDANSYVVKTIFSATDGYIFEEGIEDAVKAKVTAGADNAQTSVVISPDGTTMTLTTVYAVNISKNRPVTALYSEEGRPASLVVDGSDPGDGENKYWQSGSMLDGQLNHRNEPQWLTVDLKAREAEVSSIYLSFQAKAWGTKYKIETSDSAEGPWRQVKNIDRADADNTSGQKQTFSAQDLDTTKLKRYVRFWFDQMNGYATGLSRIAIKEITITGVRSELYYDVNFESNGGSAVAAQSIFANDRVVRPAVPTKDGYTFDNWYTDAELTTPYNFESPVRGDLTLYAGWQASVTFMKNDGTDTVVKTEKVTVGEKVNVPADVLTRTGYDFAGWYANAEGTGDAFDFNTPINSNTILYAKWTPKEYTVTFDTKGGSEVAPVKVLHGNTIARPTEPTMTDKGFAGWYKDADCTAGQEYNFSAKVTESFTLYAKWVDAAQMVTITFDSQGGSPIVNMSVEKGQKAPNTPANPQKDGYTFKGWFKEAACTTQFNFASDIVNENITLYAKWEKNPVPLTGIALDKTEHTFTSLDAPLTVKAICSPADADDMELEWTSSAARVATVPKTGTAGTAGEITNVITPVGNGDAVITVKAKNASNIKAIINIKVELPAEEFTVSFVSNCDTEVPAQTIAKNGKVTEPSGLTKDGYTFDKWYTEETFENAYDFDAPVTGSFTLYARWIEDEAPVEKTYQVTFESNGGSVVAPQEVKEGEPAVRPENPARDGYTFDNWYSDEGLQTLYAFDTPVTADITLYAKWTQNTAPGPGQNPNPNPNPNPAPDPGQPKPVVNGQKVDSGNNQYKVLDAKKRTIAVSKGMASKSKKVKIPSKINVNGTSFTVIGIANNAFKNYKKLTEVTIPASVKSIGSGVFMNCKSLKKVTIQGKSFKVGKNSFKGTSPKLKVKAKKMTAKQRNTLQKNIRKKGNNKKAKVTR